MHRRPCLMAVGILLCACIPIFVEKSFSETTGIVLRQKIQFPAPPPAAAPECSLSRQTFFSRERCGVGCCVDPYHDFKLLFIGFLLWAWRRDHVRLLQKGNRLTPEEEGLLNVIRLSASRFWDIHKQRQKVIVLDDYRKGVQ